MAKQRVFELARELGVTSKVVLEKCRAEGIDIKNHMSTVSAGLAATICEWFSEGSREGTAVETAAHVDLGKARADAKKVRRRKTRKKAELEETAVEPPAPVAAEGAAQQIAEPIPEAPVEVPEIAAEAAAPAEPAPPAEEAGPAEEMAPAAEAAPPEEIMPAGPQVIPKPVKLKGPRVVRVESPESVAIRPRRRAGPATPAEPSAPSESRRGRAVAGLAEPEGKKGKRRSPRRRGRSAESGETLREWREADLEERSQRLAAAGGGLRRHRANVSRGAGGPMAPLKTGPVAVEEPITIKSLSEATGVKSTEIIGKLMALGEMATINQVISREAAETVVGDYGIELVVQVVKSAEDRLLEQFESRKPGKLEPRAPVVTFLGHVDHGKTSLLDRIRNTAVAEGEAGGITQHIGAYRYDHRDQHVVFLDTPGHEAFTAMRARGANMTDVVVLVVAADDGVMPQTLEAINHAKAAGVPIVVALNKIDLPNTNVQRVLGQLAEQGVQARQWGGQVEVMETSATTGQGIDSLIETLSLEAEILELQAEKDVPGTGFVVESQIDPGRGAVARLLVRNGTLRQGDVVVAGQGYGRVRRMVDSHGREVNEAGPSTPVEITGLDGLPEAGDRFYAVDSIDLARQVAEDRWQRSRAKSLAVAEPVTLDNLFERIEAGEVNRVPLIVKADVQGSLEAIIGALEKLGTDEVRVAILHAAAGGISTGDVTLAEASEAIIIGFNVVPDAAARSLAEEKGVDIRLYRVIYEITEDVTKVLSEGLAPEIREETLGRAEVRQVFRISRVGTVAGCFLAEGNIVRNAKLRIIRDNVVVEDERDIESLKRFKDDVREVRSGMECGVKIAGYDDIKEGDVLEFYRRAEVARTV